MANDPPAAPAASFGWSRAPFILYCSIAELYRRRRISGEAFNLSHRRSSSWLWLRLASKAPKAPNLE